MPSTLNPEIQQPGELHGAIVTALQAAVAQGDAPDLVVSGYQDFVPAAARDRQVLVEMAGLVSGADQNDGRKAQVWELVLYAVISRSVTDAQLQAINLASALSRFVDGNTWGWNARAVQRPYKLSAEESFLIAKGQDHQGYEAWEVRWHQQLNLGSPQYEDDPPVTSIYLGINPSAEGNESEFAKVPVDV